MADCFDRAQARELQDRELALQAVLARSRTAGPSLTHCQDCGDPIPEARRALGACCAARPANPLSRKGPPMSSRATPAVRIGKLERDLAVLDHRLGDVERLNRDVPPRLTRLEQQFEHMTEQLDDLNAGQQKLTSTVDNIGRKITWALGVASTLWALLQMFGPVLLRLVLP